MKMRKSKKIFFSVSLMFIGVGISIMLASCGDKNSSLKLLSSYFNENIITLLANKKCFWAEEWGDNSYNSGESHDANGFAVSFSCANHTTIDWHIYFSLNIFEFSDGKSIIDQAVICWSFNAFI